MKIDFLKTYDSIAWGCLLHIMKCVNFNQKWINWISAILKSTKLSILVNGSPTEEFSPLKGIRQGDPLAFYLFLHIGEVLSKLINKALAYGVIQGIKFDFHVHVISHFQYADDTILFIKNEEQSIFGLKKYCFCFKLLQGYL